MKIFIFFFTLSLAIFFQVSLMQKIDFYGVAPNLPLVIVFFLIFFSDNYKKTMFSAMFLGLLFDIFSGVIFGVFTLTFIVTAFLAFVLSDTIVSRDNILILFFISICGTLFYALFSVLLIYIFSFFNTDNLKIFLNFIFFRNIIFEAILNSLLIFVLSPLKRFVK
ncbi:MAG: rod shape-determining protein MreD [Patescibacteria group bacterium]